MDVGFLVGKLANYFMYEDNFPFFHPLVVSKLQNKQIQCYNGIEIIQPNNPIFCLAYDNFYSPVVSFNRLIASQ